MKAFKSLNGYTAIASSIIIVLGFSLTTNFIPAKKANALVPQTSKFVGNIIASNIPAGYENYWNQVTPENSTKWGSVEANRDNMNWNRADMAYDYAKSNGMPFKFHTLIWGSQEPLWIGTLSQEDQRAEVLQWIQAAAKRYPDSEYVDVVNEPLNAPASYRNALGGSGSTGWDWIVWSFEQARKHFPNSKLLINEYGVISSPRTASRYVEIINILKKRGLIDGIGIQCHQFNMDNVSVSTMNSVLNTLSVTGLPIYISELDITGDDDTQLSRYKEKFPVFWQNPNVKGITIWGWIEGATWIEGTHLFSKSSSERPALTWLKQYLKDTPPSSPTKPNMPLSETSAFTNIEAEDYNSVSGSKIDTIGLTDGSSALGYISRGDYILYNNINFGSGASSFKARVACGSDNARNIELRLNASTGTLIGTLSINSTGSWDNYEEISVNLDSVTGLNDLYMVFDGAVNFDWFTFIPANTQTPFPSTIVIGDVDGNGIVNALDFGKYKMYLLGLIASLPLQNGDIDKNGIISSIDFTYLMQYLMGDIRSLESITPSNSPTPNSLMQ